MLLSQKYTLAQVGEILDRNPSTLRTHINRGFVTAWGPRHKDGDKPAGKHSQFTYFTVIEFALAYHLNSRLGLQLDAAFDAARHFAHFGDAGSARRPGAAASIEREPGVPFHHKHGRTLYAFNTKGSYSVAIPNGGSEIALDRVRRALGGNTFSCVEANELFDQICSRLGLHPYTVLDEIYNEDAD